MARCVLLSGAGDYADPWHPFDDLARVLVQVLQPVVGEPAVRTDVEAALAEQTGGTDLLVVNVGNAGAGTPGEAARAGLHRHLAAGRALLVLHVSATGFPDWPDWEAILGGRWVEGTTFHPERGTVRVRIDQGSPIVDGLRDFETEDEAYTALGVHDGVTVLAHHDLDGVAHPLGWVHRFGDAPVGYLALGHDVRAYDAEGTRDLVRRTAGRLIRSVRGA
jgi:type 1 glutamine amidotransferase